MKAARNYILGTGGGDPPLPGGSNILKIKFNVSSVNNPVIALADFKYNKDVAFSFGFDDALINHYNHIFPLFIGGVSKLDGVNYPGLAYSDGTGKMINFFATMVVPAAGVRVIDNEDNPASYSWVKLKEMVDKGFGINNHTLNHGGGPAQWNKLNEVKGAEQMFYERAGYRPTVGTTPASEDGFMYTFRNLGYFCHNSTYNEGNSDLTIQGKMAPNEVPTSFFNLNRVYPGDSWDNDGLLQAKNYADEIYGIAVGGKKQFGNMFTHGPGDAANITTFFNYVLNHPSNTNKSRLWVPSVQEFLEYFSVKRTSVITKTLVGTVMTITIDQTGVPNNVRDRSMSLLAQGFSLGNLISVEGGAASVTHNPSTGLINVYNLDATRVVNPTNDVLPAQITALTRSGNNVNITFDKGVTQTAMAGYSVTGKNITALTGSGTSWAVTCNSAVGTGQKLNYRSFIGNAVTVGTGLRVCDYIDYPIS